MVCKVINWEFCKKIKFDHTNKMYMHNPESQRENAQTSPGFWDTNGSPNHDQTTRPSDSQEKREPAE